MWLVYYKYGHHYDWLIHRVDVIWFQYDINNLLDYCQYSIEWIPTSGIRAKRLGKMEYHIRGRTPGNV